MAQKLGVTLKTETERLIFEQYESEKEKRQKLEGLVNNLTSKLEELQRELQDMRERSNVPSIPPRKVVVPPPDMYETDEEELARETEWVRQKSRKKRKLNKSPSPQPSTSEQKKIKVKKTPLPPPIVVEKIINYQQFYDLLSDRVNKDSFLMKMMSDDNVKINANGEDSYRAITKLLSQNSCLWHSYENKQDRPIRVMVKNLHSSCLPERINEDLNLKGLKILSAVNKLKWKSKEPLNMWILSFGKDEDIQKIYGIKSILGCKVDVQPLKSSKLIPQCKKCQSYGHTQRYCSKEARCVKCTGKHLTRDCNKPADAKPKCIHCGESHPANYRGCIVAKELQNIRNKLTKKTNVSKVVQTTTANRTIPTRVHENVTNKVTFAQIAKDDQANQNQIENNDTSIEQKLNQILSLMLAFDERIKKLENDTK